jgi:ribosome-associated protein
MEKENQEKSRSQVKREAEELQKLGERLMKLPMQKLKHMDLPEKLFKALKDAKSIKSNVAGRRQRQFIGALMREVDPEPIRNALQQTKTDLPMESKIDKETQKWIDRLLTGNQDFLEEFIGTRPGLERQRLRQLLRNIKKEQAKGKASKSLKILKQLIVDSINNK